MRLILHDRITAVEEYREFCSRIDIGFVRVNERYVLAPSDGGGTVLETDDEVRSSYPGLGWLALGLTRSNVGASMTRLKQYCEGVSP